MARNLDDNYAHTYQKYLKHKENYEDFRRLTPNQTASTKILKPVIQHPECKICKVLAKPGDVCKVLHQGLYHKYTSSQDYFYTRDINSLLMKKRKEFCIRYYDDLIYDECKERLKGYFRRKETQALMNEIKQFYTKFKNFPRNFHSQFYHIINSNIRKQRRLEYIRVFNNVNLDEDRADENDPDSQRDYSKNKEDFNFMEMLGSSFLQDNYKDMSGIVIGDIRLDKRRNTEQLLKEIDTNFKALYKLPQNTVNDPTTSNLSNAVYNKNYMLYSRNDSETAEDMLRQIVNGFKDVDFSRRPSMTLAEQVLQKVAPAAKNPTKKPENRPSPKLKQRGNNAIESSPTFQNSKGSISTSSFNVTSSLYQLQKQQNQPLNMAKRVPSNPRTNSQADSESTSTGTTSKVNQSKLSDQRKSNSKFSLENLNDLAISRDQILNNLYQFRSTRTKSGATKSSLSTSKTSSSKTRRPLAVQCNTQGPDSTDSRQQTGYYLDNKSPSPSPERKPPKEEVDKSSGTIEVISLSKAGLESPHYNPMKRSTSNGPGLDIRELSSPTNTNMQSQKSAHKKSSSVVKRGSTMTRTHMTNPSMQNLHTSSTNNISILGTENPASPTVKFINPLRTTLGSPQMFYHQRNPSPLEDKRREDKTSISQKMRNLDIRALKTTSPKGMDNYRMATMSMSGRHQNLSDLSQGMGSFICNQSNQTSLQASKNNSQPLKRKKATKAETQTFGSKITKRASATPTQISNNIITEDTMDKDKRTKKVLELSDMNVKSYKDLRLQSKEQTPMNFCPSSTTSMNKLKVEVKKSLGGSYTVKGSTKDLRLTLKK